MLMSKLRKRFRFGTLQLALAAAALVAVVLVAAGCGSSSSSSGSTSTEKLDTVMFLPVESQQPDTVLDPAFFYGGEALGPMNAAYEGLVKYEPNSEDSKVIPAVAKSWEISKDGKTYTFEMQPNATFASGEPADAEAAKSSFERFQSLEGGPSYMLAPVVAFEAPNPGTFVMKLKTPNYPLIDYLASPYGPKLVDPSVVKANEQNGDQASDYLTNHTAGTGPFQIESYKPNTPLKMVRNENYWGAKPPFKEIVYKTVEDPASRLIEMRKGNIQLLRVDQSTDFDQFESEGDFETFSGPSLAKQYVAINQTVAPFDNPELRAALRSAIDREKIVESVWGSLATPSEEMLPSGILPAADNPDPIDYEPEALKQLASELPESDRHITFVYNASFRQDQRMGETITQVLSEAGFDVKLYAPSPGEEFWEPTPPNLFITTTNPDAATPDAWARIFYYSWPDGSLNYLRGGSKEADKLMNEAVAAPSEKEGNAIYSQALAAVQATDTFITIANVRNAWVADEGFVDYGFIPAAPFSLDLARATFE